MLNQEKGNLKMIRKSFRILTCSCPNPPSLGCGSEAGGPGSPCGTTVPSSEGSRAEQAL